MSAAHDATARLRELERILSRSSDALATMRDEGLGATRAHDAPVERIRRLTAALDAFPDAPHDPAVALATRLLLDDCATAIGRLRVATRTTADGLDTAAAAIDDSRKRLWGEHKLASKEAGLERDDSSIEDGPNVELTMMPAWQRYYGVPRHDTAAGLRHARFARRNRPRLMRWLEGLEVLIVPGEGISRAVYVSGLFEPCTATVLRALLHEGDTFVDAGANVGLLTMLAARWVGPHGVVASFEPSSREFARLEQHVTHNHLDHVRLVHAALADRVGTAVLHVADAPHSGHNTLAPRFVHETTSEAYSETVPLVRLDDYLAEQAIARVHVVKIDVEGTEPEVIAGGAGTIDRDRPAIVLEMGPQATAPGHEGRLSVETRLRALGYVFVAIDAEAATLRRVHDLTARAENFLAAPPEAVADLARRIPVVGLGDDGA